LWRIYGAHYRQHRPNGGIILHQSILFNLSNLIDVEVRMMSSQSTLAQLEQQVAQLSPNDQLKLMAHIAEQLSSLPLNVIEDKADTSPQQREREADEILALCDAAAEMWEGQFDVAEEIRQMRKERDEQVWPSTS
jgi:transcriptional regulator with XRE-family HTH domain